MNMTRRMSQRYVCPVEYTLSQNLKLNLGKLNPKRSKFRVRVRFFWLVLGFVLVLYSAGQKYRWLMFLVVRTNEIDKFMEEKKKGMNELLHHQELITC